MKKRILRGHHLLCVHGFKGMGYSPGFVEKMSELVEEIRDQTIDFPIQVVVGLDETCVFCPNKREGYCNSPKSDSFVISLDENVISHLGIKAGEEYKKSVLVSLVAQKVEPRDIDYLCEDCSWLSYGVCKEGIGNLKKGNKKY
ncbi:MAG TPA: DUF1284 domain-containing protein [Bacillales bacterium]|nr:DUF1284 domain-containing protein [Bacillales bacterium]